MMHWKSDASKVIKGTLRNLLARWCVGEDHIKHTNVNMLTHKNIFSVLSIVYMTRSLHDKEFTWQRKLSVLKEIMYGEGG